MRYDQTKKALFVVAGSVSLGLGVAGVFLPVLPTTPFLLLAAFCYLRSSQRLYDWLMNHRIFGAYIQSYITYRAIRQSVRIGTLAFLWLTLLISILIVPNTYVRVFLVVVGTAVSIHLVCLRTMPKQGPDAPVESEENEDGG